MTDDQIKDVFLKLLKCLELLARCYGIVCNSEEVGRCDNDPRGAGGDLAHEIRELLGYEP